MKKLIVCVVALLGISNIAYAQPGNNGGGNGGCGVGQMTNGCGGTTGGTIGGAGGTGIGVGIATQAQGQVQGQQQGQFQSSRNTNVNANANSNRNSNRNSNIANGGNANSSATGGNSNQSQDQSVNNSGAGSNSNNYQQSGIPVSSATAPSFAIGSCQWAFSGGLQLFGTGVSAGSAGMYEFCKGLMKAKHMQEVGEREVAKALECQDSSIRAAYKTAGKPCQEDMPRQVAQAPAQPVVPVLAANALPSNCMVVQPGNYITCQ